VENLLSARPIAIFDSGLGGLTVAAEIHNRFPAEDIIFLGDRARVPYASLSPALIARYALECFDFLARFEPKIMVTACNTVSAVCIDEIRARNSCPVIDVITPTAAAAATATKSGRIGVLATTATVRRRAYDIQLGDLVKNAKIFSQGCPLFVPLVEEGWTEGEIPEKIVEHYLQTVVTSNVDTVVLGCTHYEYFRSTLQKQLGEKVTLINTPKVTADLLNETLLDLNLCRDTEAAGKVTIYSSDITDALYTVAGSLFDLHDSANPIEIRLARTSAHEITV